jgi:hypothetical protein
MTDLTHDYVSDGTGGPDFKCWKCGGNRASVWHANLDRNPPKR